MADHDRPDEGPDRVDGALSPGDTIGHYLVRAQLGAGGMGVVYRALDSKLKRDVALKILPLGRGSSDDALARFRREAEAVAALSHPNIVQIYSIDDAEHPRTAARVHFLTMELVDGRPLSEAIPKEGLNEEDFLGLAMPMAEAVAAAHEKGIVHRDLKPGNIMIGADGAPKVLDFGLAKLQPTWTIDTQAETRTTDWQTRAGVFMGTPGYASPEQIQGSAVDARSDVFALGCVFFRMLSGRDPFEGPTAGARISSLLGKDVPELGIESRPVPPDLRRIVATAMQKDPEKRYASAGDLARELREVQSRGSHRRSRGRSWPAVLAAAAVAVSALGLAWWWAQRANLVSRTYTDLLPKIVELQSDRDLVGAWSLARDALRALPGDERVVAAFERSSSEITIELQPPEAVFSIRSLRSADSPWIEIGRGSIGEIRLPAEAFRWRAEAPGYVDQEGLHHYFEGPLIRSLRTAEQTPEGMVHVPEGIFETSEEAVTVASFWIDRFEVTNREYRAFVDAGRYRSPELAPFEDATGQPGPAGWRMSRPPDDGLDLPVTGVSWAEAQAYCESLGKELPTFYHWFRAAKSVDAMLPENNFNAASVSPVGSHDAISEWGASDLAGNVREWIVNPLGDGRYVVGGSFRQPEYMYEAADVAPVDTRIDDVGFRCMLPDTEIDAALRGPLPALRHDFREDRPIDDELFAAVTGQFSYDPGPLEAKLIARDESEPRWIRETVSYTAAYGGETISAHLYLPRDVRPPYQATVYFPGSAARDLKDSSSIMEANFFDFLPASGRVLVYPIYNKTYERGGGSPVSGISAVRELLVQWSKDVSRTVDYLESRDDIDADRIAFVGLSMGGYFGPIFVAMEPRFRANVFIAGGLATGMERYPPEIHPLNHAPRISAPTLMVSGRWDFFRDVELEQRPLYDAIGLTEPDKRFALLDGGHVPDWDDIIAEVLDWLDLHLGRVDS